MMAAASMARSTQILFISFFVCSVMEIGWMVEACLMMCNSTHQQSQSTTNGHIVTIIMYNGGTHECLTNNLINNRVDVMFTRETPKLIKKSFHFVDGFTRRKEEKWKNKLCLLLWTKAASQSLPKNFWYFNRRLVPASSTWSDQSCNYLMRTVAGLGGGKRWKTFSVYCGIDSISAGIVARRRRRRCQRIDWTVNFPSARFLSFRPNSKQASVDN